MILYVKIPKDFTKKFVRIKNSVKVKDMKSIDKNQLHFYTQTIQKGH